MKSIQSKILCLILSCVLISTSSIIAISVINFESLLADDSTQILNLLCAEKKQELNERLSNIEQSVNTIYHFANVQLGDNVDRLWNDKEYMEEYLQKIQEVAVTSAENTYGAVTVYCRFNPKLAGPTAGMFIVKEDSEFKNVEVTDFSKYEKTDFEHVGWYYIPVEQRKKMWVGPYYNANLDIEMVSYVVPIFSGGTEVGIIGMDIKIEQLTELVENVSVYDTGYAFLLDADANIMHHKDFPEGIKKENYSKDIQELCNLISKTKTSDSVISYTWNKKEKRLAAQELRNGMVFAVCVPVSEIEAPQRNVILFSLAAGILILLAALLVTVKVTKVIIHPLKQLTEAAKRIANVDLDVTIECKSKDEVGVLAQSFKQTAEHLKNYIAYINRLAFTDVLTNLQNKTAYKACVEQLEQSIADKTAVFTVIVFDINNLKVANDNFGHEAGDLLIQNAAWVIRKIWGSENTYRIGGDEFVAIVAEENENSVAAMVTEFEEEILSFNQRNNRQEVVLQVAVGTAIYDAGRDRTYIDVFRRADDNMYQNKAKKKAHQI